MADDFARLRREYTRTGLAEGDLPNEPMALFRRWFEDARQAHEPNAMVLATVSPEGQPSARTVLLKGLDERGFCFFTNLGSRKAVDLAADPRCALLFGWYALERQVRVEGPARELPRDEVAAYFASRPRGAQLGAWASPQSSPMPLGELDRRYAEAAEQWPGEVPVPEFWGGYVVVPDAVEFWQGRQNRMHDRWRYERTGADWTVRRLAP